MKLNEFAMISGILNREQDARDIRKLYRSEYLKNVELQPILNAIYTYIDEEQTSPSLQSLTQYLIEKDSAKFEARWRSTLEQLKGYDNKSQIYNIKKAKEIAASYELQHLLYEQRFQGALEKGDSNTLKAELSKWLSRHTESEDEGLFSIQEAFDKLLDEYPWQGRATKISTGIKPIDNWSGGLRPPQMGIIIAPTGGSKSALLMNIARHAAAIEQKTVLFITNELTVSEQTERFLVRMQNPRPDPSGKLNFVSLNMIQDDSTIAYRKLEGYQKELDKHLYIYSAGLGQNVEDIEEIMKRLKNERGKFPDLLVIDFIERLGTKIPMDRNQTWTFVGQISKELSWLAKRRNCAIWTAAQTNRSGMNTKIDLSMEHAQGSVLHLQEASLVLGVRKVQVIDSSNNQIFGLEFKELKSRHTEMSGRKMILNVDLSRMYISDVEIKDIKEIGDEEDIPEDKIKKSIKSQKQIKGKI